MNAKFWSHHPALLYGFAGLLGVFTALYHSWLTLFPITLFLSFFASPLKTYLVRLGLAFLIFVSFFFYIALSYHFPDLPENGWIGTSHIQIKSISQTSKHFGKQWIYKGTIRSFLSEEDMSYKIANIPFKLVLPINSDLQRPPANHDYLVKGRLKLTSPGLYSLFIKHEDPWSIVEDSWSLAEWRYQVKKKLSDFIQKPMQNSVTATFLNGIMTGNFDDRRMQFEFGRFGLQHIMAISGFHFAILTSILGFFFRLFISPKKATFLLILMVSAYFFILGPSPSVMRAWITIGVFLVGFLFNKQATGLNSLGFAILIILLYDPLSSAQIGFQLSFLATAAILMLFNGFDNGLKKIFLKKSLSQAIQMNRLNQHGYILLSLFRQGIALSLAVNIATLPLVLYYFHKFSLISLIYNLFFPFLVSVSMILLVFALLFSVLFSPLGDFFHLINESYTTFVLNYIYNMPKTVDRFWSVETVPTYGVIIFLCIAFYFGLWMQHSAEKNKEQQQDFAYL